MIVPTPQKPQNQEPRKNNSRILAIILFLLLLLLFFWQYQLGEQKRAAEHEAALAAQRAAISAQAIQKARHIADSITALDSAWRNYWKRYADSLRTLWGGASGAIGSGLDSSLDSAHAAYLERLFHIADSLYRAGHQGDMAALMKLAEELANQGLEKKSDENLKEDLNKNPKKETKKDSVKISAIAAKDSTKKNPEDTMPPAPPQIPPTGRYYEPINLKAVCDEPKCQIQVSYGDSLNPEQLDPGKPYNKSGKVYYRTLDSLGNPSGWVEATYDMASDNACGKNAYPVPMKGKTVCVDAYEYPNQKGERPQGMVSHEKAVSLCAEAGKHLCTAEEWQAACLGKNNTRYPYGERYYPSACATDAKEPNRSGYAERCRSYWGQFDMSGNLWEWTASPAKEKPGNFLVAGGAWNTRNKSFCSETKFSFYPQNEYPFVGFRCCR